MQIGITSIQKNRNPWILEWIAFHLVAGFNRFYIYCHNCSDGMDQTLLKLSAHYPITVHNIASDEPPQLVAYQHAINSYIDDVDWMAFIDGDEFLFSPEGNIEDALRIFSTRRLSAIACYWRCYGSNGHLTDPGGLIIEKFPRHSRVDFPPNRHIKTILRGGQAAEATSSHLFRTADGTYDENMSLITHGLTDTPIPSYRHFRINHYTVQSYDFFSNTKKHMGAADCNLQLVRPDEWYFHYDRNEEDDGSVYNYIMKVKLKIREMQTLADIR